MWLGLNIIAPALPLFGKDFGVGSALVGLLITAFGLGRMILNLPAGVLADRMGRRSVLLGSSAVIFVTAWLAAVVSNAAIITAVVLPFALLAKEHRTTVQPQQVMEGS
jgi:MFS family permease